MMPAVVLRAAAALAIVLVGALGTSSVPAQGATIPAPARLPLDFNEEAIRQDNNDGLVWDRTGTWQTTHIAYHPGRLTMTVRVTPPATGLPGRSGPAVLFGRLSLFGGPGGDIGWEKQVGPTVWAALPTCDQESACTYTGQITLATEGLYRAVTQLPHFEDATAFVDLSLARSFDQGALLQVMPLFAGREGLVPSGTLARPLPASGEVPSFGAFPRALARPTMDVDGTLLDYGHVVDQIRHELGDPSTVLPTVTADLDLDLPGCRHRDVQVRDADWNVVFYRAIGPNESLSTRFPIIDQRDWSVVVSGTTAGTFSTAGTDVLLQGSLTCQRDSTAVVGSVIATATHLPPLPPTDTGSAAETQRPTVVFVVLAAVFGCAWLLMFARMTRRLVS